MLRFSFGGIYEFRHRPLVLANDGLLRGEGCMFCICKIHSAAKARVGQIQNIYPETIRCSAIRHTTQNPLCSVRFMMSSCNDFESVTNSAL